VEILLAALMAAVAGTSEHRPLSYHVPGTWKVL
jgi:hypothetical protein